MNDRWDFKYLEEQLTEYGDREVIKYFKYGRPLNPKDTDILEERHDNQEGARANCQKIREYLDKELQTGSIIGPFHTNPFGPEAWFSPLDMHPKKDTDELRVILNLSYLYKAVPVNHSIDKTSFDGEEISLRYPKIIQRKGKRLKIFKHNLKKCYSQFFMCPSQIHLLGFCFKDEIYFDVTLSMGSRSTAYCCQRTTNCITFIFHKEGFNNVNYLDDLGGAEESNKAETTYEMLGDILIKIGITEVEAKSHSPSHLAIFLGILYNMISMTMELTEDCLREIRQILQLWKNKETATLKEIQCLLGKLNFACSTVRARKVFISKIINSLKTSHSQGKEEFPMISSKTYGGGSCTCKNSMGSR